MTAALAASTTLTGPTFAFAEQRNAIRLAQADDAQVAPPAEPSEAAPSGEASERPRRQRQEAQPEAGGPSEAEPGQPRRQRGEAQPSAGENEEGEQPRRQRREAQPEAEQPDARPAEEAAPTRRERRQQQQSDGEAAGAPAPGAEGNAETPRRERRNRQDAQPEGEAQPAQPSASETGGAERPQRRQKAGAADEAPAPEGSAAEPNGAAGNRRQRERPQPAEPAATTPPAEPAPAAPGDAPAAPGSAPAGSTTRATPDTSAPAERAAPAPAGEVPATPPAPSSQPAAPNAATAPGTPDATPAVPGSTDAAPPAVPGANPPAGTAAGSAPNAAGQPAPEAPGQPPAPGQAAPGTAVPGAPAPVPGAAPAPGGAAQAPATAAPPPAASLNPQPVPADVQNAPIQPGRINQSDARVQTLQQPVVVQPITQERGERLREAPRYELPPDANVVKREGDRQILSLGAAAAAGAVAGAAAGYFIRSNDDDRLAVDSRDRYTERLPRGRTRETIVRENGVQVVTITNRYGDVVQRSRVMPDGREVVLFYDPYSDEGGGRRRDYFDDPGRDLPPIRVDIPEDEYVVDVDQPNEELYYDTLVAPPVETVERIYSVDEVRRSPRIREKVRRIDLATINFNFASSDIAQDQVDKLQDLAEAIQKIVKDNPGETFLIEGHTDAVGSPQANLVLSDKRAESVASALSQYFDVPSENLVTQGYGEQELKVNTEAENRENRRVTVRRITALVKPVETSGR